MSIADHFDRVPDASLVRDYDARVARRQFNTSLMLLVIVAIVTAALSFVVRFEPTAAPVQTSQQVTSTPAYVGRL